MSYWRTHPFHALLLLTEKPARWPAPVVWLLPLGLAALVGWLWSWVAASAVLALALVDWALLATLPRQGISFGSWQSPFLGLSLVRGLCWLLVVPWAASSPTLALVIVALVQSLVCALIAWSTRLQPFQMEVSHVDVAPRPLDAGAGLRLVHLSDLHVERLTKRERELPGLVRSLKPDIVVITGDYLNTSYNTDPAAVADLAALLGQLHAPLGVYAVWGTPHVDYPDVLRPALEGAGIHLLENRAMAVRDGDQDQGPGCPPLWVMGITPTWDLDADAGMAATLQAAAPPGAYTLLLYHVPDLMPAVAPLGVDLFLAGHTHGGQWRVPGFGAIATSSRYGKRYEAGLYREGRTRLYVTRGLGLEGFGTPRARVFCRPEIAVLDLPLCAPSTPGGGERG